MSTTTSILPLDQALPTTGETSSGAVIFPYAPSAVQKRAMQPLFVPMWSIQALLPRLPFLFLVNPDLPPSPKTRYRSHYRYLGTGVLLNKAQRAVLTDFQTALYLIDFSPLERVLAQIYVDSIKGQVPFHPVSMFLCIWLRRERNLSWRALALELAGRNGAGWRELFGFEEGQTPSASGLRHFYYSVGPQVFDDLCPRSIDLLRQHGLFPERSTYPGDPQDQGITVIQDGMLHPALSHPSCQLATGDCYRPLTDPSTVRTPEISPDAKRTQGSEGHRQTNEATESTSGRQCRARENGLPGCACDTEACRERCRRASALDPEARFIHYEGHNDKQGTTKADGKKGKDQGTDVFGYRSVADRGLDDRFAVAWNLQSGLYPANTDERTIFTKRLEGLQKRFPGLKIGEWIDDSGVGYGECLEAIWDLGALRMVDIRHHESDYDPGRCLQRGYDKDGHPLCPHGYRLHSNGYDYDRRRRKYVCRQACRREPLHEGEAVCPVADCPYLDDESMGFIVNVGKTLPDDSIRLAREIPYGSEEWGKRYGRRNVSESRNGQLERMGLKRMRAYGLERDTKEVQVADFLMNLRTLGRLVREATNLAEN